MSIEYRNENSEVVESPEDAQYVNIEGFGFADFVARVEEVVVAGFRMSTKNEHYPTKYVDHYRATFVKPETAKSVKVEEVKEEPVLEVQATVGESTSKRVTAKRKTNRKSTSKSPA